ncbi:uncharacterized protein [Paramormyrops kingsleyae]|uniref:uncharacterized protein n=1 Tax=Paramormyrops kingsleyae TaxID=1676925 RepID=UPI000CD6162D|nr:uncharacterized protein LOC111837444 [Paramormyrops kingsleyae]
MQPANGVPPLFAVVPQGGLQFPVLNPGQMIQILPLGAGNTIMQPMMGAQGAGNAARMVKRSAPADSVPTPGPVEPETFPVPHARPSLAEVLKSDLLAPSKSSGKTERRIEHQNRELGQLYNLKNEDSSTDDLHFYRPSSQFWEETQTAPRIQRGNGARGSEPRVHDGGASTPHDQHGRGIPPTPVPSDASGRSTITHDPISTLRHSLCSQWTPTTTVALYGSLQPESQFAAATATAGTDGLSGQWGIPELSQCTATKLSTRSQPSPAASYRSSRLGWGSDGTAGHDRSSTYADI